MGPEQFYGSGESRFGRKWPQNLLMQLDSELGGVGKVYILQNEVKLNGDDIHLNGGNMFGDVKVERS